MIQKDTAFPEMSVHATLTQEIIRRLQNCSESLDVKVKQDILSDCSQKFINSGFTCSEARVLVVQGVTKYLELLRLSRLSKDHKD